MWDGIYCAGDGVDVLPVISKRGRPELTVLTMFVAREQMFNVWLKNFHKMKFPKGKTHILWLGFPKGKKAFAIKLKKEFLKLSGFHSKTLVINHEHQVVNGGDKKGGNWTDRNQAITDGYNFSREYVNDPDYVLLLEDDIIAPETAYSQLLPYMENNHIGQICGRVPYRPNGRHRGKTLAWNCFPRHVVSNGFVNTEYEVYYVDKQHGGVEEVGATTFGCTLIRGHLFRSTLMQNKFMGIMGPDVTYGPLLKSHGFKSLLNNWVHCKQMNEHKKKVEVYA